MHIQEKHKMKDISCYSVFDLKNKKLDWEIEDVECLMFKPPEYYMNNQHKETNWLLFGETELNEENESNRSANPEYPEKILAVRKKTEVVSVNDENEEDPG